MVPSQCELAVEQTLVHIANLQLWCAYRSQGASVPKQPKQEASQRIKSGTSTYSKEAVVRADLRGVCEFVWFYVGRRALHCICVCVCLSIVISLNVRELNVCVCVHVYTMCFHHTRDTCTLPRSIPLSVTPMHGPPFHHAVSNPKQMISGKYRAKVGGMEGGIRWADKKKGRKKNPEHYHLGQASGA